MFTLGGYPLCSAVQRESHPFFYKSLMSFPHFILQLSPALLGLSVMGYLSSGFTAVLSPWLALAGGLFLFPLFFGCYAPPSLMVLLSKDLSLALLLLENMALQLFPISRCMYLFGTFYAGPLKLVGDKLLLKSNLVNITVR